MAYKVFKAILDWAFGLHGYLDFKRFSGSVEQMRQIKVSESLTKGKAKHQDCKVCGTKFWATKRNNTCRNLICFVKYAIRSN